MAVTLADYLTDLRDIIHDPNDRYWSEAQMVRYINRARLRRDMDIGGFRNLINFQISTGVDTYAFSTISAGATPTPFTGVILDVLAINLFFVSQRVILMNPSFTQLNANWRPYVNGGLPYRDLPRAWSRYGDHQIVFGPAPAIDYNVELDVTATQTAMADPTDEDALQEPYCRPVIFYAAYLGKLNERMRDEAMAFLDDYTREAQSVFGTRLGPLTTPYFGTGR